MNDTTKHILQSKTFWFNVAGAAMTAAGYLPPKYSAPALAIGNIVLRYLSTGPVSILPQGKP